MSTAELEAIVFGALEKQRCLAGVEKGSTLEARILRELGRSKRLQRQQLGPRASWKEEPVLVLRPGSTRTMPTWKFPWRERGSGCEKRIDM